MTPYWTSGCGRWTVYLGDCLEVLPTLAAGSVDAVIADPPFGIGKADWDTEFNTDWMPLSSALANTIAVMPGTWNILRCPQAIGDLEYKWTLSAHLSNGMTRGGLGFGNWIPCLVYSKQANRSEIVEWCCRFAEWCEQSGVSRQDLDAVCGTSDMGGWWSSRLPHRCEVPAPHQWQKIRDRFNPPSEFDGMVRPSQYEPKGDCRSFVIGLDDKPNHPSPKPLNVMQWIVSTVGGDCILDPFLGSGTTLVACVKTGRRGIGIEIDERYAEIAVRRIEAESEHLFKDALT